MRSSNSAFVEIEWFETGKTGKQHWIVTLVVKCSSNSAFGEIEWFETGKQHWIVTLVVKYSSNSAFGEIEWFETGKTTKLHWIVTLVVKCSSNSALGEIEWFETGKVHHWIVTLVVNTLRCIVATCSVFQFGEIWKKNQHIIGRRDDCIWIVGNTILSIVELACRSYNN